MGIPRSFSLQVVLEKLSAYPTMERGRKRLFILLGLFGDFDSLEYIQAISKYLNKIEAANIKILVIGIGDELALEKFSSYTNFSVHSLQNIPLFD